MIGVSEARLWRRLWVVLCLLEAIILGDGGRSHTEVVRLLVGAGADVNLADGEGVTPLEHARQRGYEKIFRILQSAGAR
jgi:uncharacterized protein